MANIDTNGVIRWTPGPGRGQHHQCAHRTLVTDSGTPPLSASNTFQVAVDAFNLPPSLPFQSNRTLVGLQALTVTNTATDTDLPPDLTRYSSARTRWGRHRHQRESFAGSRRWARCPAPTPLSPW